MSVNKRMPIYIFFGLPGGGKGTLARECVNKLKWAHLSTGDLCRKHIQKGTELGKQIDFAIKSGKLVSDSVIIDMAVEWLKEKKSEGVPAVILDGMPRTIPQAKGLLDFLKVNQADFCTMILELKTSTETVIARLSSRRICENKDCQRIYSVDPSSSHQAKVSGLCDVCGEVLIQRSDDQPGVIPVRLKIYEQHAQELLSFYKKENVKIAFVNGNQDIEKILEDLIETVGQNCDSN